MGDLELTPPPTRVIRKRVNKAPDARFKPDVTGQLDPVYGCLEYQLPKDHIARALKSEIEKLSFAAVEAKYSSQGQHGYHPRHLFGALVYGSILGIHHSTKLATALREHIGLRFIAGGHSISEGRLRAFKRENLELFTQLLQQLVQLADERCLLNTKELAVDSVRLRADASTQAVRTLKRSRARLKELGKVDTTKLDEVERAEHDAKVMKHSEAVVLCEAQQRSSVVLTSPGAGLMKFPSGASAPGHRATVVAAGVKERFIIDVLVDGDASDFGKLGPAVMRARKTLEAAGVAIEGMQVAGDAGYFSAEDLAFAAKNKNWVDVLIAERSTRRRRDDNGDALFDVDDFVRENGKVVCPAQRPMNGPLADGGRERWEGVGCDACGLKASCTRGTKRTLTIDTDFHSVRDAMRERLSQPGAKARYNKRIATVEPAFSVIEDAMAYRRVTTHDEESVKAEVLLKVLAYNLKRLLDAKRLRHVRFVVDYEALPPSYDAP